MKKGKIISCPICQKDVLTFPSRPRLVCSYKCLALLPKENKKGLYQKICKKCFISFRQSSPNQFLCGSIKEKKGCSYENHIWSKHNEDKTITRKRSQKWYFNKFIKDRHTKVCAKCKKNIIDRVRQANLCLSCKEIIRKKRVKNWKSRFNLLKKFNFTCQYCGRKAPEVKLEIDHIKPRAKGGLDDIDNLTVACRECNMGKCDVLLTKSLGDFWL